MKQETKVKVYQGIYGKLKQDARIQNLGYPKQHVNYDFFFDVGKMHVTFSLMAESDLFRMETAMDYPGYSDLQLGNICSQLPVDKGIRYTYFNERITLKSTHPFVGKSDEIACKEIEDSVYHFIDYILQNADKLKLLSQQDAVPTISPVQREVSSLETSIPEHSNPVLKASEDEDVEAPMPEATEMSMGEAAEISICQDIYSHPIEKQEDSPKALDMEQMLPGDTSREQNLQMENFEEPGSGYNKESENSMPSNQTGRKVYDSVVAGQMREMYADMEHVFTSRKKQLDFREDTLDKREAILNAKADAINKQTEELKLSAEQWDIREAEFERKNRQIELREETLVATEKELDKRQEFLEKLEDSKDQENIEMIRGQLSRLQEENQSLKDYAEQLKNENKNLELSKLSAIETGKKNHEQLYKTIDALQQEKEELTKKNYDTERQLCVAKEEYDSMHSKYEKLMEKDSDAAAIDYLNSLSLDATTDSNGICASYEGTQLIIQPNIHMIRVEKSVRKGAKYRSLIAGLNQEDITCSFIAYDKKIVAHMSYNELSIALEKIKRIFSDIR